MINLQRILPVQSGRVGIPPVDFDRSFEIDRRFPKWARRSNPIVRRHLGGFWKALLPETRTVTRLLLFQVLFVLISLAAPWLLEATAIVGLISFFVLPLLLVVYGRALLAIGNLAVAAITDERQHHTLDLLRTTPFSLRFILLSKIAASVWRQANPLGTIILASATISLPPIILEHIAAWPLDRHELIARLLIILGLVASVGRLLVEPLMIGALGILAGSTWRSQAPPATWTALLGLSYFTLINLPRLLPLEWPLRLLVETVLPLALPVVISWGALWLADYTLRHHWGTEPE